MKILLWFLIVGSVVIVYGGLVVAFGKWLRKVSPRQVDWDAEMREFDRWVRELRGDEI